MQIISSRIVPFIQTESLEADQAREILLRDGHGFLLYLTDGAPSYATEERIIALELREALIWLNETAQDLGSFWG
jgi:hypothetical protein